MTTFTISEADFVAAQRLFNRPTRRSWLIRGAWLAVLLAIALFAPRETASIAWFAIGGTIVGLVVARKLVLPIVSRRQFRGYKGIRAETTIVLEDSGVRYTTADANVLLRWNKLCKWRQDTGYVLLYHSPRLFNIVPRSLAAHGFDMAALTARLETEVGAAS